MFCEVKADDAAKLPIVQILNNPTNIFLTNPNTYK